MNACECKQKQSAGVPVSTACVYSLHALCLQRLGRGEQEWTALLSSVTLLSQRHHPHH